MARSYNRLPRISIEEIEELRQRVKQNPELYHEASKALLDEIFRPDKRPCVLCPLSHCMFDSKIMSTEKDCSVFRAIFQIKLAEYKHRQDMRKYRNPTVEGYAVPGLGDLGICRSGRRRLGAPLFEKKPEGEGKG